MFQDDDSKKTIKCRLLKFYSINYTQKLAHKSQIASIVDCSCFKMAIRKKINQLFENVFT